MVILDVRYPEVFVDDRFSLTLYINEPKFTLLILGINTNQVDIQFNTVDFYTKETTNYLQNATPLRVIHTLEGAEISNVRFFDD